MGYVFISYSSRDTASANMIRELFNKNKIDTWMAPYDIPVGSSYSTVINDAIKNCSCFLFLLTEDSQNSAWVMREVERAYAYRKTIIPVKLGDVTLNEEIDLYISRCKILSFDKLISDSEYTKSFIEYLKGLLSSERELTDKEKKELLYSQIIELQHGDSILFSEKLFDLIELTAKSLEVACTSDERFNIIRQLTRLYELYWKNPLCFGEEYKKTAARYIDLSGDVIKAATSCTDFKKLLLSAALTVDFLRKEQKVKDHCDDIYTDGDVIRSDDTFERLYSPHTSVVLNLNYDADYTRDEIDFINEMHRFVVTESYKNISFPEKKEEISSSDNQFQAIADYFAKGNELFCAMENNNQAEDFFNCLLLSYERLKNYCLEVGAKKTYSDCVVKISELKQSRLRKRAIKAAPTAAERGIKALLGLTMPKSGSFDAFISYKHYDEDRAHRVYSFLQQNLKEVFFDKESLPELSKSDYEHAVMTALDNSKHFIVIISKLELLESSDFIEGDWVRREMRAFNTEIQEGRKKDANFIILASDEVCDEIFAKNKENIDIMWRWPEIIRFSEFEKVLAKYVK